MMSDELMEPWLYAISETNREGKESWYDGEQCVFGDRQSAQDEVDLLNDDYPEGEFRFKVVPLYRAALAEKLAERGELPSQPTLKPLAEWISGGDLSLSPRCYAPDGAIQCSAPAAPPVLQAEQASPALKCVCQPIHSQECVFRDARSSQYRHFYAHEVSGEGPK